MKRHSTGLAVLIACIGMIAPVFAQAGHRPPGPPDEAAREELQETIEIYMIARLKRSLDLTDAQERKVIPLVEELNAARREMHRRRRLNVMKLHLLVEEETQEGSVPGKGTNEAEIASLLDRIEAADRDFRQTEERTRGEIRAALSPVQQARFLFFQERFRQEMQERMRRLDPEGRPRRGGPPPGRR